MKKQLFSAQIIFSLALLLPPLTPHTQTLGDPEALPFTLQLEPVTQAGLPGLHSFAIGKVNDWWVLIGGRINGLHGFFIATGFPDDKANADILLLNPEDGTLRSFPVEDMNLPFVDALRATNPQYVQDENLLYITGGFGKDIGSGTFKTFPVLTVVDLPLLRLKMLNGENPEMAFLQIEESRVQVCGGEMGKMGDWFYLVGGHKFSGLYNQNGAPQFTQTYTNEIRRFKIGNNGGNLAISDYSAHHDSINLHRRDFTLAPFIRPNGTEAMCLYGGVFRPDADLPYYNPVFIEENNIFEMDASYEQLFSQYTCPVVPLFDDKDSSMYTVFFGGLSVHYWDNGLKYDERVPFVKDIITFRRQADGTSLEFVLPQSFDELLGSNMVFVPAENAPKYPNEVFKLRAMNGPTFVGYLYGGIHAEIPNFTPSSASKRMFKVYITPKQLPSATSKPETAPALRVFPNPFSSSDALQIQGTEMLHQIELLRMDGHLAAAFSQVPTGRFSALERLLQAQPSGLYMLKYSSEHGNHCLKVVKQ